MTMIDPRDEERATALTRLSPQARALLAAYLTDWLAWARAGAPRGGVFSRCEGLCINTSSWSLHNPNPEPDMEDRAVRLELALDMAFEATGCRCPGYPFGEEAYYVGENEGTMHEDENRLAWVENVLRILRGMPDAYPV